MSQPGSALTTFLAEHTARAPAALRARVLEHAEAVSAEGPVAEQLALAAERVVAVVEEHPGDRRIALDLLAADALITLALLAQSEAEPGALAEFAERLLAAERVA